MLAQAAKNAGLKPLVIDLFVDLDTQRYAEDFRRVSSLTDTDITSAVDYFIKRYAVAHVIYGSGFEYYPESLCYLDSRLIILGNSPETFLTLQNKPEFFAALNKLAIPYPEAAFKAPACINGRADDWLVKPMQGKGGVGIKRYCPCDSLEPSVYWQKYQQGTPHSVLFLADGHKVQVIGFNRQWISDLSKSREFIFSGVINSSDLSNAQKRLVTNWLQKLVSVFGLKGLNSLDFIRTDEHIAVLEINARPSASMQLYNDNLLLRHIEACLTGLDNTGIESSSVDRAASSGRLGKRLQPRYTGYQIVYAMQDVIIPNEFAWPEGCMDLPESGVICRAGQPICSIIAHQNESEHVLAQLLSLQQFIINKLERF